MSKPRELSARPRCAVCGHKVERFTSERDEFMGRVRFVAYCHGATETVDVPIAALGRYDVAVNFGLAFAESPRRIAAASCACCGCPGAACCRECAEAGCRDGEACRVPATFKGPPG